MTGHLNSSCSGWAPPQPGRRCNVTEAHHPAEGRLASCLAARSLIRLAAVAACVVALACASDSRGQLPTQSPSTPPISSVELAARSYWSFGEDWWRVVFNDDLTCRWSGTVLTPRVGEYSGAVQAKQWADLVACLEALDIDPLAPTYASSPDHDGRHLILTVHRGDDSKSIDVYEDQCPAALLSAQMTVLGLAEQVDWRERAK